MAKQALDGVKAITLPPTGMNDATPLHPNPDFYQTRGVHSLSERCLRRMEGKFLLQKLDAPVLNIHAALRNAVFVETSDQIILYTDGSETPAGSTPPDSITIFDTPSIHWSVV